MSNETQTALQLLNAPENKLIKDFVVAPMATSHRINKETMVEVYDFLTEYVSHFDKCPFCSGGFNIRREVGHSTDCVIIKLSKIF